MKVGLDVRMIENSGIGTTIRGFLDNLTPSQRNQLILFSKDAWKNPYDCPDVRVPYPIYSLRQHWLYPALLKKRGLSFFHMPHYDVPLFYRKPFMATVYDLIHILFPAYSTKPFSNVYARLVLSHVVKNAEKIIVISKNTKKDLETLFSVESSKVELIYPGIDPIFKPVSNSDRDDVLKKHQLEPQSYLLFVGNLRGSKNTEGLVQAYTQLKKEQPKIPSLVLVGKNSLSAYQAGFPAGVVHKEGVQREDLPALYTGAKAFLFPSFYEGFGLPPLEAMACGAPVLTSGRASLPEVCGEAALYVDPDQTDQIKKGIARLLDDTGLREDLVKKGFQNVKRFSWKSWAEKTWDVYNRVERELKKSHA